MKVSLKRLTPSGVNPRPTLDPQLLPRAEPSQSPLQLR